MLTILETTSDGVQTIYDITFGLGYLDKSHVYVYSSENVDDYETQLDYTWVNNTQIELAAPVTAGQPVKIRRVVPRNTLINDYEDGSILHERNLDDSFKQALMILQEIKDGFNAPLEAAVVRNNIDMLNYVITNLGTAVDSGDAVSLGQLNSILAALSGLEGGQAEYIAFNPAGLGLTAVQVQQLGAELKGLVDALDARLDALEGGDLGSVAALITQSGMPEGSENFGTFTQPDIPDNATAKTIFEAIGDKLSEGLSADIGTWYYGEEEYVNTTSVFSAGAAGTSQLCSLNKTYCAFLNTTESKIRTIDLKRDNTLVTLATSSVVSGDKLARAGATSVCLLNTSTKVVSRWDTSGGIAQVGVNNTLSALGTLSSTLTGMHGLADQTIILIENSSPGDDKLHILEWDTTQYVITASYTTYNGTTGYHVAPRSVCRLSDTMWAQIEVKIDSPFDVVWAIYTFDPVGKTITKTQTTQIVTSTAWWEGTNELLTKAVLVASNVLFICDGVAEFWKINDDYTCTRLTDRVDNTLVTLTDQPWESISCNTVFCNGNVTILSRNNTDLAWYRRSIFFSPIPFINGQ